MCTLVMLWGFPSLWDVKLAEKCFVVKLCTVKKGSLSISIFCSDNKMSTEVLGKFLAEVKHSSWLVWLIKTNKQA